MDELLETIDLDMEENHDLLFKVNVEGNAASPARVRLVCEAGQVSYMFEGHPTEDEGVVQFVIPQMSGKLNEEKTCLAKVEVLIDNRYFAPVQFGINFKKTVKVFAEAVHMPQAKKTSSVTVSAVPIVVKRQEPKVTVNESPRPAKIAAPPEDPKESSSPLRQRYLKKKNVVDTPSLDSLDEEVLRSLVKDQLRKTTGKKKR